MVQVNTAHDKKDLLALLRLQLEIEQINPAAIAALASDKLRHYNRVLKEQLKTLTHELELLGHRVRQEFNFDFGMITPKTLQAALRFEASSLRQRAEETQRDLRRIQDHKNLKAWLKEQIQMMDDEFDIVIPF
jgi:hypothetical protein